MDKNMQIGRTQLTKEELRGIKEATTYTALSEIALGMLNRIQGDLVEICGPISTGGRGNKMENLKVFHETIEEVAKTRLVFDQLPFEKAIKKIIEINRVAGGHDSQWYDMKILEEFYKPIFVSGLIRSFQFINGWESSKGARWENDTAVEIQKQDTSVEIIYLE